MLAKEFHKTLIALAFSEDLNVWFNKNNVLLLFFLSFILDQTLSVSKWCVDFKSFAGFHTQNADVFHAVMAFGLGFWLNWCNHTVRTSQPPPVKTFCLLPNVSAICLVRRPLMGLAYFTKSFQFPFLILTHQNSTALHSVWIYPNLIKFDS